MDRDRSKDSVVGEEMASSWYGMKRSWILWQTAYWDCVCCTLLVVYRVGGSERSVKVYQQDGYVRLKAGGLR